MNVKKAVYEKVLSKLIGDKQDIDGGIRRQKREINELIKKQIILKRSRLPIQQLINDFTGKVRSEEK